MNTTELYLYLTACAVNGIAAQANEADFDALWQMTLGHNMTALAAKALTGTKAFKSADAAEKHRWTNALNNSVKKTMLFDAERRLIIDFLEKNGIWYMPLKGAVLNAYYPSYGTREFADNDILIDPSYMKTVRAFMEKRGYFMRCDNFAADEYSKDPFYNFEIHRELVELNDYYIEIANYYRDVNSRLIKDEGNGFGFHFSDDDFYIFFVAHAYKHYKNRGTGFRTVADEYVLLNCGKLKLNFKYIESEMRKLGAEQFERTLRSLASGLFSQPEQMKKNLERLSADESEMLQFILSCGTFGNFENLFKKEFQAAAQNKRPTGARYYFKRIFPDISRFKYSHPFVYNHKIIYPFFLVYRNIVNPIRHRRYLKREIQTIHKIKSDASEQK